MSDSHAAGQVFDDWAADDRARRMWQNHLPRVRQIWQMIPRSDGHYLEIGCGCGMGLRHVAENQYRGGYRTASPLFRPKMYHMETTGPGKKNLRAWKRRICCE